MKVGELIAWGGTYGGYPIDTISHVGIITEISGGKIKVVDRATSNGGGVKERDAESIGHIIASADISQSLDKKA